MEKPLWNFFLMLRERSPLILTTDQYLAFHQALIELPNTYIENIYDLRDFCQAILAEYPRI